MDILAESYMVILPIITTALSSYIVWLLQQQKKNKEELDKKYELRHQEEMDKRNANAEGTKLILFYMLQRLHVEYMYQGFVNHEQRTQFRELYEAYHELGGNGYGTRMWEDVKELDIRNDKDAVSPFIKILKDAHKNAETD